MLVLEARERLGGACTLDTPFEDKEFVLSPCAYVIGLLDETVISDLQLNKRGLEVYVADPQLWVPFEDGTAFSQWMSHEKTLADLRALGLPEKEIAGYDAYETFFDDMRIRLRKGPRDSWAGESPSRPELEEMLQGDQMMIDALFEASISDVLDEFVTDQRLKDALFGQGVIGTCAGPQGPGHRVGEADALPGRPARRGPDLGLRQGRHGHGQLRDRRGRARGRGGARGRRAGRRDPARARASGSRTAPSSPPRSWSATPTPSGSSAWSPTTRCRRRTPTGCASGTSPRPS